MEKTKDVVHRLPDGMTGGLLSFPLSSFREDGGLDLESYRTYLTAKSATAPGAVFPACGTGEFSALDEDEYRAVVQATVEIADGRLPVIAGIGYCWAQALRFARIAEEAGADAALVLPHYLVEAPQDGLVDQVRRIAAGTRLPFIAYQRGPVGRVRAPLVDPVPADLADLADLEKVLDGSLPWWEPYADGSDKSQVPAVSHRAVSSPRGPGLHRKGPRSPAPPRPRNPGPHSSKAPQLNDFTARLRPWLKGSTAPRSHDSKAPQFEGELTCRSSWSGSAC